MTDEKQLEEMCESLGPQELIVGSGLGKRIVGDISKISDDEVVETTLGFFKENKGKSYFWADPTGRFNRTEKACELCMDMDKSIPGGIKRVLILSAFPSETRMWYESYKGSHADSKFCLISKSEGIAENPEVLTPKEFQAIEGKEEKKLMEFITLPELKAALNPNGDLEDFKEVENLGWDLLIVDAPYRSEFGSIQRNYSLYATKPPERPYLFSMSRIPESAFNSKEGKLKRDIEEAEGNFVVPEELGDQIRSFYKGPGDESYLKDIIGMVETLEDQGLRKEQISDILSKVKKK